MKRLLSVILAIFLPGAAIAEDCVVLLHGLARTEISLTPMQLVLEEEGYFVVNRGYPSTEATIQTLVEEHVGEAACGEHAKVTRHIPSVASRIKRIDNFVERLGGLAVDIVEHRDEIALRVVNQHADAGVLERPFKNLQQQFLHKD